jgi:RNAse (barnase) inhibitor barstar
MDKKTVIIDGNNFSDMEGFYIEIDKVLTKDIEWKTGHNLNAFNDLLCGGFGVYEGHELVNIIWRNFSKSKDDLNEKVIEEIVSIINSYENITFIKE